MALFVADHLRKQFGGLLAVNDLSFAIDDGEILALIGPNGAGKTTVFNLISGVYAPDAGRMTLAEVEINALAPDQRARLGIGRAFQLMQPFAEMTVLENVMVGELYGHTVAKSLEQAKADALAICDLLGLAALAARPAAGLGVADLKRLEMARALATHPRLLLLDEVLAGLTPTEARDAVATIGKVRESGVTVLLIDHVMHSVRRLCDRVVVMNFGQKIAEGSFERVAADPQVIDAYLGEDDAGA